MRISSIARKLSGRMLGDDGVIEGMASLFCAQKCHASVVMWPKDVALAKKTKAACLICDVSFAADFAHELSATLIVVEDFFATFQIVEKLIKSGEFGARLRYENSRISANVDIHESAVVLCAEIGDNTFIGPHVFIDNNVSIGNHTHIAAGAVVLGQTRIGAHCQIGSRAILGSDAFVPYSFQSRNLCSLGGVEVGNHVLIKAGCTLDRGLIGDTQIGNHSLIDNLVHVGHDVVIGENVVVAAQSGFAGFVRVGNNVTIGGQCGFSPHAVIGEGARISGKTLIHGRVKPYEVWSGNPGLPHEIYLGKYKSDLRQARNL